LAMPAAKFGDDWIVDLQEGKCLKGQVLCNTTLPCTPNDSIAAQQACQVIELAKTGKGIFAKCQNMGAAKLDEFKNSCEYDICADKNSRCQALTSFVQACQLALPGARLSGWRTNTSCPMTCPPNQYYSECVSGCPATCAQPNVTSVCNKPCVEGCTCADGFKLDGTGKNCTAEEKCGCKDEKGNYFETDRTWMNSDCTKAYKCMGNNKLITRDVTCGAKGTCSLVNSENQCKCVTGNGKCKTAAETMITTNPEYLLCTC